MKSTIQLYTTLCFCIFLQTSVVLPAHAGFDHTQKKWTEILSAHVNDRGRVNYKALLKNRSQFDEYIKDLESVKKSEINSWNRDNQLAYWINTYNALAMKIILDNYPIKPGKGVKAKFYPAKSIKQIPGAFDEIKNTAAGQQLTLNYLEHELLRKKFKEPRIHFAIVCVSVGCPYIWNHAFEGGNLEEQLSAAARRFVKNRVNVRLNLPKKEIYLSKIFKWFNEDFSKFKGATRFGKYNGVVSFCSEYFSKPLQKQIHITKAKIIWYSYDWTLNEQ